MESVSKPILAFIRKATTRDIVLISLLLHALAAVCKYSGTVLASPSQQIEYDYPVHAHWMSMTATLPPKEWYSEKSWYSMDYPPLACYIFAVFGKVFQLLTGNMFEYSLTQRLHDSIIEKTLIRGSVIVCEAIFLFPPIVYFVRRFYARKLETREQNLILLFALNLPAYIVVDHCHGQFNCVQLGTFCGAIPW